MALTEPENQSTVSVAKMVSTSPGPVLATGSLIQTFARRRAKVSAIHLINTAPQTRPAYHTGEAIPLCAAVRPVRGKPCR